MEALVQRIAQEGSYLGKGIIKVDGFINHQLDPLLTLEMGTSFATRFAAAGVTQVNKIVTAEVSGIAPALAVGIALGVPVVYARKKRPITMATGTIETEAPSRTKGGVVKLIISPEYLGAGDRVLLIDDFLATGQTIGALARLILQSGATLAGIGCVIEKLFETGRADLDGLDVPIITLAQVDVVDGALRVTVTP